MAEEVEVAAAAAADTALLSSTTLEGEELEVGANASPFKCHSLPNRVTRVLSCNSSNSLR